MTVRSSERRVDSVCKYGTGPTNLHCCRTEGIERPVRRRQRRVVLGPDDCCYVPGRQVEMAVIAEKGGDRGGGAGAETYSGAILRQASTT